MHAAPHRQLTLGQAGPAPKPQDESAKTLDGRVVVWWHGDALSTAETQRSTRARNADTTNSSVVAHQPVRQLPPPRTAIHETADERDRTQTKSGGEFQRGSGQVTGHAHSRE